MTTLHFLRFQKIGLKHFEGLFTAVFVFDLNG
jgi:hypothetical protein